MERTRTNFTISSSNIVFTSAPDQLSSNIVFTSAPDQLSLSWILTKSISQ